MLSPFGPIWKSLRPCFLNTQETFLFLHNPKTLYRPAILPLFHGQWWTPSQASPLHCGWVSGATTRQAVLKMGTCCSSQLGYLVFQISYFLSTSRSHFQPCPRQSIDLEIKMNTIGLQSDCLIILW